MQTSEQTDLRAPLGGEHLKNVKTMKMIGGQSPEPLIQLKNNKQKLDGLVDGIIATCAGDAEGDKEILQKLQYQK